MRRNVRVSVVALAVAAAACNGGGSFGGPSDAGAADGPSAMSAVDGGRCCCTCNFSVWPLACGAGSPDAGGACPSTMCPAGVDLEVDGSGFTTGPGDIPTCAIFDDAADWSFLPTSGGSAGASFAMTMHGALTPGRSYHVACYWAPNGTTLGMCGMRSVWSRAIPSVSAPVTVQIDGHSAPDPQGCDYFYGSAQSGCHEQ